MRSLLSRVSGSLKKLAIVKTAMTALNAAVLAVLISWLGFTPAIANLIRVVFTSQVRFSLYRGYVYKTTHQPLWRQWRRYQAAKAIATMLNQAFYWLLVSPLGMRYFVAYLLCLPLTGGASYFSQRFIFTKPRSEVFIAPADTS